MIRIIISLICFSCLMMNTDASGQQLKKANPYGGHIQLRQFIKDEMVYPAESYNAGREGKVGLTIRIDESGSVKDIKIFQSVSADIDREAIRIMNKVLWEPAEYMGRNIADQLDIYIKFHIKRYRKSCRERGYDETEYLFKPVDFSNRIYNHDEVDKLPQLLFEDETMTLSRFINENIEYPEEARQYSISGTETVEFIVEPHGRISNLRSVQYVGAGCCEETMRLVKMLKWCPGILNNQAVRVRMKLNITFNLSNESDIRVVPSYLNQSMH